MANTRNLMMASLRVYGLWAVYSCLSLLLCVWLAWHAQAQVNFLYPVWYSLLDIDQTVATYAPKNQYKFNFEKTNAKEHARLFGEMVKSIQNEGDGLSDIDYFDQQGVPIDTLLTQNEIVHLQDVANLVQRLNLLAWLLGVSCLLLLVSKYYLQVKMPSLKKLSVSVFIIIALVSSLILLLGAKDFFYWLHLQVFPDDHQWFFYYEESLMSTLMKAPILFAPISAQLVLGGCLFWWLHLYLLKKLSIFKSV